ncbi:hypothetical protein DL762_002532 [Monosporascus cannonballus]|uniref:Uncharacterized protein n=1 Tax=Monosporascus cannonballus TaxID=155416 RepID=A0ABY0HEJ1_9PEZI|nr:hypothetical protein DL762_002532 [Monosporascus cannonballus]
MSLTPDEDKLAVPAAAQLYRSYNDTYVIHYDFSETDETTAVKEFQCLCRDLREAGLQIEVRLGLAQSLLVFAKAPNDLLGSTVYKSRVKDYLYGITNTASEGSHGCVPGCFEAEDALSMYHLVNWSKENGGAGITPGFGKWKNVKSIFPIHNEPVNKALLKHLSKRFFLTTEDLDRIRDLFGSKVAFYFAYMQTYLRFLSFSAVTGVFAWAFLPKYSLVYAIITLFGCTVFLEYWKIRQADLSMRWDVKGVGALKVNQPKFQCEKIIVDAAGRTKHYFPKWKSISRQLLQIPFFVAALLALGAIITCVFAVEIVISETYGRPYKWCLEYLPTLLLAASLPYISSYLEDVAAMLTDYENHRTYDYYEMSLTQKIFGLSFVANYFPILLTAFVYIPLSDVIVPQIKSFLCRVFGQGLSRHLDGGSFQRDSDRLRNELIALTITGQLSDMAQEFVLPYAMHRLRSWYHAHRSYRSQQSSLESLTPDNPSEKALLQSVQRQASLPPYNVQDDISEMVIQFGYLALFSPVWPLVSVGFFVNNWIELRSDFFKICVDHRRPHPVRTDGLGPWIGWLDTLAWLGSISTAAVVHVFGTEAGNSNTLLGHAFGHVSWWSLPVTIWLSEHIFLAWRSAVQFVLQRIGSDQMRRERIERYARRKKYLEDMDAAANAGGGAHGEDHGNKRGKSIPDMLNTGFSGTRNAEMGRSEEVGIRLIKTLKQD